MNSSNNLKSGQRKLSVQVLVLVVVIILVATVGILMNKSSSGGGADDVAQTNSAASKLLKDIYSTQTNLYKIQHMVASSQDAKAVAKLANEQAATLKESVNMVKRALASGISAEQKKYYSAVQDHLLEYEKAAVRYMKLAPEGTGTPYLISASERVDTIGQLLSELAVFESKATGGQAASSSMFYLVLLALLVLLLLSVLLIPALVKSMMGKHVVEPLQETSGVLRDYAGGKFSKTLSWEADDAIGELVQSVNALRIKMSATVSPATTTVPPATSTAPLAKKETAPKQTQADESSKSLSDMIKKTPDQDTLVLSSKKAIDKLQDI